MTHRHPLRLVALGAMALVLLGVTSGCATTAPSDSSRSNDAPPLSPISDPELIVGNWKVTLTDDASATNIVLQLGHDIVIWDECGYVSGGYILTPTGELLTDFNTTSGGCRMGAPDWFPTTVQLKWTHGDLTIVDRDGTTHAVLEVGGQPPLSENYMDEFTHAPTLTDDLKRRLRWEPVELPHGLVPATTDLLVDNTWYPSEPDPKAPGAAYIRFAQDHRYEATDGCNGTGGLWWIDPNGSIKLTFGASTAMGCDGVDVISQFYTGAALAADTSTGELVLLDSAGIEIASYLTNPTTTTDQTSNRTESETPDEETVLILRETPPAPADTVPANAADVVGIEWAAAHSSKGARIEFTEDGTLFGYDGCNGYGSQWLLENGALATGGGHMTLALCSESLVADDPAHDSSFLNKSRGLFVDESRTELTFTDRRGTVIARFVAHQEG